MSQLYVKEDPQLKQDYLELIESRLIISDEKAHEIHINIMGEFAKIRIGVFDDMVEVLLANNKTYLSHKLYKYMPNFIIFWHSIRMFS